MNPDDSWAGAGKFFLVGQINEQGNLRAIETVQVDQFGLGEGRGVETVEGCGGPALKLSGDLIERPDIAGRTGGVLAEAQLNTVGSPVEAINAAGGQLGRIELACCQV